jgi:sugar-specific transcriptional regulator TrmB
MEEKILVDSGLSTEQARIYLYLIKNGLSPAKVISNKTAIGRALVYKVLNLLEKMDLVGKKDLPGKTTLFFPKHPQKIKDMLLEKQRSLDAVSVQLKSQFGAIASAYNLLTGKPNVQFYEGVDGIKDVYDDILVIGQDIQIISSPIDEGRKDVLHLIREQIKKQVEKDIKTKAITPLGNQEIATPVSEDEKHLIIRKQVPSEKLHIPAQIIIYGDKVAITNFKESIITVVIDSKYITETFKVMFEFMWESIPETRSVK